MTQLQAEKKAARETKKTGQATIVYTLDGDYCWTLLSLYVSDKTTGLSYALDSEIDCIIRKE